MAVKVILTFTSGSLAGRQCEFTRPAKLVIGRSDDCDVQLPTTPEFLGVSRRHCLLDIDPPVVRVRDLGSRNGTFLNGQSIGPRRRDEWPGSAEEPAWHALGEGDELCLGGTTIRVGSAESERERVTEAAGRGAGA